VVFRFDCPARDAGLAPSSRAQQAVLETPQQTNDRIRALSSTARLSPHDYVIGNGDVIDIEVFDVKELSREVRVSQTGSIVSPWFPSACMSEA